MAGIKQPIADILAKLTTLQVINQDSQSVSLFARIWNDQFKKMDEGKGVSFPLPAAFLEVLNPASFMRIGAGFDASDITFRIHLGHWFTDAMDGTFEQDLEIFGLRDNVIALLSNYKPTGCGPLVHINENQNYEHDNVYVYEIDFTCHFIDSKSSPYDPSATKYIDSTPPTGLEVDVTTLRGSNGQPIGEATFRIPIKHN